MLLLTLLTLHTIIIKIQGKFTHKVSSVDETIVKTEMFQEVLDLFFSGFYFEKHKENHTKYEIYLLTWWSSRKK